MSDDAKEPRCILAPNPSPLTGPGTNSFLIGRDHVAVIDPGPDDPGHLSALARAGDGRISHIFVTHAHRDHSAGAATLSRMTGAPVLAFGDALAGRSQVNENLARSGLVGGGEGLDLAFRPDIHLTDGEVVATPDWSLRALHSPGHAGNHICLQWDELVFCGDIVMGWSSTIISPPDGDLVDYLRSLDRIAALAPRRLLPGHGDQIEAPLPRMAELATHRRDRTRQILAALRERPDTAAGLATRIYQIPDRMLPAATRNVLAHLIALTALGVVAAEGEFSASARFVAD